MGREFDRSVLVGIVLLAALVAANAAVSLTNTRRVHEYAGRVAHTREVMAATASVRADLRAAEAAQRTFLLTGDESTYEASRRAEARARTGLSGLKALTADDPDQQARLAEVGDALDRATRQLEHTAAVRRREGDGAAARVVAEGASRRLLDETDRLLGEADVAEQALLAERTRANERAYSSALAFGIAAAAFGLVAVGMVVWLLRRSVRARASAASAVHREREWLRTTLASIGDAVIATDAGGNVTFLNPVAEALTGWAQREATGRPLTEVFHIVNETSRKEVENPALRALREGVIVGLANHTVLLARDGTERPIDDSAAPIRDGGAIGGAVLVFRDISERKKAEEVQARLAAIVESSDDAIIGKTLDGVIRYWNAGAERIFGYAPAEAVGRPITLVIPPERLDEERDILGRLRRGERIDHFETVRVAKDGRRVDISLTISPIRDAEGHVVGASKVARDVTERKRVERALRESEERSEFVRQASGVGFWYCDLPFDVLQWDERVKAHFWLPPDAPVTIGTFYERIHPDDRAPTRAAIERSIADRDGYDTAYRTVDPGTGAEKWVRAIGRTFCDEAGNPRRFDGVTLDVTEQRRAEAARWTSEERFRAIVEATPECVKLVAPDGTLLQMNSAGLAMVEGDGAAVGQCVYNVIAPEDRDRFRDFNERVCRGEQGTLEFDIIGLKGTRRHMETTAVPLPAPQGGFTQLAVTRDVTARKRSEAALRERDERLQLFLENATDYAVIISDTDDRAVEWLGGAERITGWSPGEAVGRPLDIIFTPEDRAAGVPKDETNRAAETGRAEDTRWHQRKDGSRFFAEGVTVSLRGPKGELRGYGKVFRDATDERRAEAALRQSEERLQLAVAIARLGTFEVDLATDAVAVNEPGREIYGWADARTTFAQVQAHFHPADRDEVMRRVGDALDPAGPGVFEVEQRIVRADGATRWIRVRGRALFEGGRAVLLVGAYLDVTERKEAEDALRDADRKKDDFIALLGHELRNPLAPIRNGLQVIRLSEDRATRERSQRMMDRQLAHMVRMIDDLLDVSRIGRHKMELRKGRVALADVVHSAVDTARPAVEEAGHELAVALPPSPVFLDADLTRLSQVFSNLLTNSAKYTERGGKIWLSAESRDGAAVVTVRDTGIGIPAAALPTIFDMFSQVDRPTERTSGGLGIGLALVKGLVEMHGGTVTAESEGEGRGSTFTVTLPVPAAAPSVADAEEANALPAGARRVLVVDDNHDGAESMADMLGLLGHAVATAHDGLEAVERAESFRPDVILMDVGMPRLNGLDATRRIREQDWGKRIAIVALTGWGQENDREKSREAGCDAHLVKPVNFADLQRVLSEVAG